MLINIITVYMLCYVGKMNALLLLLLYVKFTLNLHQSCIHLEKSSTKLTSPRGLKRESMILVKADEKMIGTAELWIYRRMLRVRGGYLEES